MIINKGTKSFLTRSDKPNENWTTQDCYVIDDSSELATKILNNYPNIEYVTKDDEVVDVKILTPQPKPLTHEEINAMVVAKIREKYDINEEFKIINLGITDATNSDYIAYREYVAECIAWGDTLEETEEGE